MAMEESRVLIWHRDKLRLSIINDVFLQTVFDHILGKDVVKKLMQVTQVSDTNKRDLRKQIILNGKIASNKTFQFCISGGTMKR